MESSGIQWNSIDSIDFYDFFLLLWISMQFFKYSSTDFC